MTENLVPRRPIFEREARGLLAEAVRLNIIAKKYDRPTHFSEERDEVLADLEANGFPTNVDDYDHPSDVPPLKRAGDR